MGQLNLRFIAEIAQGQDSHRGPRQEGIFDIHLSECRV